MVILIFEQHKTIGSGHFMRCTAIHQMMYEKYKIDSKLCNESEFIYSGEKGNIYVLDFFDTEKCTNLIPLLAKDNLVVTFDYFSNDALPDMNVSVFEQFGEQRLFPNYIGLQYFIIRNEFAEYKPTLEKPKNIFVYIGGNGSKTLVDDIAKKLSDTDYAVNIVRNQNSEAWGEMPENFNVFYLPKNIVELMDNSEFAITSPGLATMELVYLQVPSVLCPLNSLHERFADYFIKHNYAIGNYANFDRIDHERIGKVRNNIKDVIDSRGFDRVAQLIFYHYEEKMGCSYTLRK